MSESQRLSTVEQIGAAQKLYMHEKMEYWRLADKILTELRAKDPDPSLTDPQRTLIKATLIDSFYNAGCGDIEKVTSWIVAQKPDLLAKYRSIDPDNDTEHIKLVHNIAAYGRHAGSIVFAAKFAHFFIDADTFPIYDQYARMLVHFHIDSLEGEKQPRSKYGIFYKKFFRLKQLLEQRDSASYSTKTLDCYLWSAGQYVAWKKGFPKKFYIHERLPFDDPGNQPLFKDLFPQTMMEDDQLDDLLLSKLDWDNEKQKEEWKRRRDEMRNGIQA